MGYRVVALDESYGCEHAFLERCGGKVWGIYFYDESRHVYCCEITPSYELHFLGLEAERIPDDDEDAREAQYDELMEAGSQQDPVSYMWTSNIDRLPANHFVDIPTDPYNPDENPDEIIREYLQGNPHIPPVVGA